MEFHRHSEMILSLVQDWLVGGKHTDVSVAVIEDGTIYSIRCHRVVLANASPFLACLLGGSTWPSRYLQDDISLLLSDVSNQNLELLISYLYTGMATFDSRQARSSFLEVLTSLGVKTPPYLGADESLAGSVELDHDILAETVDILNATLTSTTNKASTLQDLTEMTNLVPPSPALVCGSWPQNNSSLAVTDNKQPHQTRVLGKDFSAENSDHVLEDEEPGLKGPPKAATSFGNEEHGSSMKDLELSTVDQSAILYAFPTLGQPIEEQKGENPFEVRHRYVHNHTHPHRDSKNSMSDEVDLEREQASPISLTSSCSSSKENNDADLHFIMDDIQVERLKNSKLEQHSSASLFPLSEKELSNSNGVDQDEDEETGALTTSANGYTKARSKRRFQCNQCGKYFPSKHYLGFHETSVHSRIKSHPCQECDKVFTGDYYLRQHVRRMHSESRPFACHNCSSSFSVRYDLVVHMRTHEAVKQFKCDYCAKTYATHRALKEHARTHTGEKPFECKECGKKFALPKTLRVHYRQHSGERPYLCSHCGMTFVQNSTLRNHLRHHHQTTKNSRDHGDGTCSATTTSREAVGKPTGT
ncbi:hypothetical protein TCAL_00441 [Tigriopus californicus]|uniref:BTB domain-containing protein n=2 Tax=Tigriopus californicus TaxID=6832 RepID=A0A553NFA9_TIGCA|nr:hypothetical protein TCAL_00441 [Tigriopus californicus]|eukprot:TCALIF_00441-PA protein Name:"Similar to ZNF782 Zinc finger protein 782 (Homo sapiens)" AED:0.08 eAED:0.10 QI:0/0/0/0.5/1/1/2/0/586